MRKFFVLALAALIVSMAGLALSQTQYAGFPTFPTYARGGPYAINGSPSNGTNCVQTLTIGGTPTGGTFQLVCGSYITGAITWSATDATLVASIKAGVEALPQIGSGNTSVAAGTGSSGIGTYTITAANSLAFNFMPAITAGTNALSGTSPTIAMAVTTSGVPSTLRGAIRGEQCFDYTTNREYVNAGTPITPSWVRADRRVATVALTATTATTGGAVASWAPSEGGPVLVTRAIVYTTTKSTGAANLSIGTAANATTSSANLIDTLAVGSATICADNITDGSTNGKARQLMSTTQYVTATGSADTTGLVGTLYIEYFKP